MALNSEESHSEIISPHSLIYHILLIVQFWYWDDNRFDHYKKGSKSIERSLFLKKAFNWNLTSIKFPFCLSGLLGNLFHFPLYFGPYLRPITMETVSLLVYKNKQWKENIPLLETKVNIPLLALILYVLWPGVGGNCVLPRINIDKTQV